MSRLALAFLVLALAGCSKVEPPCTTDTDCMVRFGGNGDPEPLEECDTFDCWE